MKRIMMVIFSVVKTEKAVDRAFYLAQKNNCRLYAAFFIKKEIPSSLSTLMMYSGYLGEKVQEDVKDTIRDKYKNRVKELKEKIEKRARKEGIELETEVIKKASLMKGHDLIEKNNIDYIIINYADDEYISQVFSDYFREDFIEGLTIPHNLYLDGEKK